MTSVATPRVVTESLGGSALGRAVAAGKLASEVVTPVPASLKEWKRHVAAVQAASTATWLAALRDGFGGATADIGRLERTASAGGVVVTTGQQAGLFGGPLYTWSKAISALALADAIERKTGVPTAPVFWAATDDADFAEANHTVVVLNGVATRLELAEAPPTGTPMALTPLGDARDPLNRLRNACGSMAFGQAWNAVERAYAGGTVGDAYVKLLRELLGPLGIAVLDSSHASVRTAAGTLMRRALDRAADVQRGLSERETWLATLGFEPQVADVPGLSTVFVHEAGIKRRVPLKEAGGIARTAADGTLSPNVLLRPVVERAILPTVAYVAGPGELAYFAQVSAVAAALGTAQPLAVPRWSCTIVEPSVDRAMERLGIGAGALEDSTALEGQVAKNEVPVATRAAFAELRATLTDQLEALRATDAAAPGGPLLRSEVVAGAGRQVELKLDRLERRLVAAAKRRGSEALRDLQMARASIWPDGHRQERTLNFIPFWARYGDALIAQMRRDADAYAAAVVSGASRGR